MCLTKFIHEVVKINIVIETQEDSDDYCKCV